MAAGSQLTLADVSDLCEGADLREIKKIDASKREITRTVDLRPVVRLRVCVELLRLDLSGNSLCSVSGIVDCCSLTWLNLSHNNLESLQGIQRLTNLTVLNASHNSISVFRELAPLRKLKALVLSHNQLSLLPGLHALTELNSLVLSGNQIEAIQLSTLGRLEKLSLSHNQLREVPNTSANPELRELRLNDNKISSLPPTLSQNGKLQLLDVGRNRLHQWEALGPLQHMSRLSNLNLQGNRVCSVEGYTAKVSALVPSLRTLDSQKLLHQKLNHSSSPQVAPPTPALPGNVAPPPKKKAKVISGSASAPDSPKIPPTPRDTALKNNKKIRCSLPTKTKVKKKPRAGKKNRLQQQPAPSPTPACSSELDVQSVEQAESCSGVTPPPGHLAALEREHAPTVETSAEVTTSLDPHSVEYHRLKGTVTGPKQKTLKMKKFGRNSGVVKVQEVRRKHKSKHRKTPFSPSEFKFGSPIFNSWFE